MDVVKLRLKPGHSCTMPPICCACGAPAGAGYLKVQTANWSRSRLLQFAFPLCDDCDRAYTAINRRRNIGCGLGLGLGLLLGAGWILADVVGGSAGSTLSGIFLVLALLALAGGLVTFLLIPLSVPRETRAAFQRATRAARVRDFSPGIHGTGSVTLQLAHGPFAARFRQANLESVCDDRFDQDQD